MQKTTSLHPLQTDQWLKFRQEWGNEIAKFDFGAITIHKLPFLPFKIGVFEKGPAVTPKMLDDLQAFGRENNIFFVKLEPNVIKDKTNQPTLDLLGKKCVAGRRLFTPETFVIDLTKNEQELMSGFHPKTRYNIRLAQKKGVSVTVDNSQKAFDTYLQLTFATAKRQGFYAHSEKYHRLMWKHLGDSNPRVAYLLKATYNQEIVTTWVLFVSGKTLYYPYGASSTKHKEVMANNLMMWEAIKFGKKMNCTSFDLWGKETNKGFTKFKEGYNPKVVTFVGTWDLVINPFIYWPYRLVENVRWFLLKKLRLKIV